MLRIHQVIQAGKFLNASTLARDLEVSTQFIAPDIIFMPDRLELLIEYQGRVELPLKLSSSVEIDRWVLGWGGDAVVVKPCELAEVVKLAARKILRE
jgi:predicted DNA-binding transcriptional regulator YafY